MGRHVTPTTNFNFLIQKDGTKLCGSAGDLTESVETTQNNPLLPAATLLQDRVIEGFSMQEFRVAAHCCKGFEGGGGVETIVG